MSRSIPNLLVLAFSYAAANAAALVPVPTMPQPLLPAAGLEANRGQASAGILFLSPASVASIGVTAQSVLFSPLGATLDLVASNPNPTVSFSNPLPGMVNSYSGADPAKWVTGIPRYSTATLTSIYSGINAQYTVNTTGVFTLNVMLAPGANLNMVQFAIPQATSIGAGSTGLTAIFGTEQPAPELSFSAPVASQTGPSGQMNRNASFVVQSATGFSLAVKGVDSTLPLQIAIQLNPPPYTQANFAVVGPQATDAAGNTYYIIAVADAAGKAAPFPTLSNPGCGVEITTPLPCTNVAVYKYSAAGTLEFITYLVGSVDDTPGFLGLAPDGAIAVAGTTDSVDFPVTAGAFQTTYAGPPPTLVENSELPPGGDLFAAILDPATGSLQSATFLGGPNPDTFGAAAIGTDGSLYFLPAFTVHSSAGMPVSSNALLAACQEFIGDNPTCYNGYAARLSPALDELIYGTFLPGMSQATAQLYSDGSVYYAGTAAAGFSATPGAYQTQNVGGSDGIVARLDPTGSRLLFATYYGGPETDWILNIALAPDGSVWANVSSFVQVCCSNIGSQLIHLDASGSRLLADAPISADSMVVDSAGNLVALAQGSIEASPGAILGGSCGGPAYVELSPTGQQLFATYLPGTYQIGFDGADANGDPYIDIPSGRVQLVENQSTPPSVGCVVDAAAFLVDGNTSSPQQISPGGIVTLFGAGMGPSQGVGFQLVNGELPTSLGGTQVTVNGEPAPLLYASYGQVNLVLPYDLAAGTMAEIQVITNGTPLNQLSNLPIVAAQITVFQVNGAAVALNQDYTVNSPQNPAQPGSTVMLFGTGGGQTSPPSVAGEVTPLGLRPLVITPQAALLGVPGSQPPAPGVFLNVEYAGAAPSLLSGVTQINVTLPATIPLADGYAPGTLPLQVVEPPNMPSYQIVTIYATPSPAPTPSAAGAP
jgi:uncharacterized protein (TIGR03437 family)